MRVRTSLLALGFALTVAAPLLAHGPLATDKCTKVIPSLRPTTAANAPGLSYSSASGRWWWLSACSAGIAALDATVVNIALPTIGGDFRSQLGAR